MTPNAMDRCRAAADELGLPAEGVTLVQLALETIGRRERCVTPIRLCGGLLECDGDPERSAGLLRQVGLVSSEAVGRVVLWLKVHGSAASSPAASLAEFVGIFDLCPA